MEKDQEFVEMVVKAIVDTPDKVKTERKVDEMGVLIELTVDATDMGKIIGKEGKTAKSIRTLLRVLGAKEHARVNLKIIEPEGGAPRDFEKKDDAKEGVVGDTDTKEDIKEEVVENDEEEIKPLEEKSTGVI
ncbi:MAG: KH domain-containing protein [Candidatus Berkelbacteria bacterium]|nr:KH domain-containing protein [Candidatus Berkelbacteria bacterium]